MRYPKNKHTHTINKGTLSHSSLYQEPNQVRNMRRQRLAEQSEECEILALPFHSESHGPI